MLIIALLIGLAAAIITAMILTPRVVEYVETIEIQAPVERVHNAIRYQKDLMHWSAWPWETGSQCSVQGPDGEVGAQTVFLDKKGKRFGYQEIIELEDKTKVGFKLESKGPPHVPKMDFYTAALSGDRVQVLLHFRNDITPPFHIVLRLAGIVRWTREMHRKDLDGLKRFVEKGEDYRGNQLQKVA
ncbi:MAG: hypothetical protein AAF788_00170 [Pseudomonadota bacterium]